MALYEVVLQQQLNATVLINRWNYVSSGSPVGVTGAFALAVAFGANVSGSPPVIPVGTPLAGVQGVQAEDCIFVSLSSINVYDDDDFYTAAFPTGLFGGVTGASSSQILASGFRTNRVTRAVRRGFKRIGAVPAARVGEFGALTSPQLTAMATLAGEMSDTLNYTDGGNALSFVPTVVSKQPYTTPAGNQAYRYWPTLTEQLAHVAQGVTWEVYSTARGQQSRQLGRGV